MSLISDLKGKVNKLRGKEPVEQDELRDAEDSLTDQSKDLSTEPDADDAIMITDEDLDRDQATTLSKKRIAGALVGLVAIGGGFTYGISSLSSGNESATQHYEENVTTAADSRADNPAGDLPSNYSDIAKYQEEAAKKDGNQKAPSAATNVAQAQTQPGAVTAATTPYNTTAGVYDTTAPVASSSSAADDKEAEAARKAKEAAEKEEQAAMMSPIAFKIAEAISNGQSPTEATKGDPNAAPYQTTPVSYANGLAPRFLSDDTAAVGTHILHAGSVIQATMLTGISTDIPNNEIVAVVRQNVYDSMTGKHILIPQGSKLIGRAGSIGGKGIKRIGVTFSRIIMPNGMSINLPNLPAIDGTGLPGMQDKYTTHSNNLFKTAFMSALVTAAAQSATGDTGGTDSRSPGQEAVAGGVAEMQEIANQLIRQAADTQATIEIRPGKDFSVFVTQDLQIPEYQSDYE